MVNRYGLAINSTDFVDEFKFDNNRLIISFNSTLVIYDCVDLAIGAVIFKVSWAPKLV